MNNSQLRRSSGMSSDPVAIPEIDRAEDWAKRSGETACQNLENRFGSPAR
jgi:hypothetical protein